MWRFPAHRVRNLEGDVGVPALGMFPRCVDRESSEINADYLPAFLRQRDRVAHSATA